MVRTRKEPGRSNEICDPPELQLTRRFSVSILPENEIMFNNNFPGGSFVTKECLLQFRTSAVEQVQSNLGVALTHDEIGDPITVVT